MPPGFVPADGDGRQESIFVLQQQSCQSRRGRCLDGVCPLVFCPSGLKTLREHVLCFAQAPCQMPTDHRSWTGSEKVCRQTFSQCLDNETKPREGKRLVGIAQQVSGRPGLTGCGPRPFAFYLPASRGPSLKGPPLPRHQPSGSLFHQPFTGLLLPWVLSWLGCSLLREAAPDTSA